MLLVSNGTALQTPIMPRSALRLAACQTELDFVVRSSCYIV